MRTIPIICEKVRKSDMIKLDQGKFLSYERIGEFHSDGAWIHPNRSISSYEIILVLSGDFSIYEEKMVYELHPGDVLLLTPDKVHGGLECVKEKVSFYWLHFTTDLKMSFKYLSGLELYETRQLMKRLLHITNTSEFSENAADALTLVILEELSCQAKENSVESRVPVAKIAEYVRMNSHKILSVAMTAEHFGYHQDYISKLFHRYFGMGLKEYITEQRIKKAKDLLLTTELSVKQISSELGYEQENLFIKFFMYHETISPTAFRSRYSHTHMNSR